MSLRSFDKKRIWGTLGRWIHHEVGGVSGSKHLALAASRALPQFTFNQTRTAILRAAGVRIGDGSLVMGSITLTGAGDFRELFTIGSRTMISGPLYVDLGAHVSIGNLVRIGHEVMILTVDHEIGDAELRCGPHVKAPVTIGDGVWIGSRVVVLPGVTVGRGSVIAAGAIVTKSVPPNTMVAGVPARPIRSLDAGDVDAPLSGWIAPRGDDVSAGERR